MADTFDWNVTVDLMTRGAKGSEADIRRVADAVDQLSRENKLGEKDAERHTRTLDKMGKQAGTSAGQVDKLTKSSEALRYANYDLSSTLLTVSATIAALGVGSAVAFAKLEKGFAQAQRTTGLVGDDFAALTDEIIRMGDAIPVTVDELTLMATRGGQLGVAQDQIGAFTETLSKFVAISDTLTADQAAESLARIANLTGTSDWEALASSIALVGVNAAATDAQIVKTTQELAQAGAAANFAADDLIGLATAFASLGVPPERARSVIQDLISVMNKGLAGQNDAIQTTARLLGVTADEAANLWQTDPAQFIVNFSKALNSVDNVTVALSEVGLEGKRAQPVFAALAKDAAQPAADGFTVLTRALNDAQRGFAEGTENSRQFEIIANTLDASWQKFLNTLMTTIAAVGAQFAPAIQSALGALQEMLIAVRGFLDSDIGGFVARTSAILLGMVAAWAAVRGAIALATATSLAFKTATSFLGGPGIIQGIMGLVKSLGIYTPAAEGATRGTLNLGAAFKILGRIVVVGTIISAVTSLITDFGGSIQWAGEQLAAFGGVLRSLNWGGAFNTGADQIRDFGNSVVSWSKTLPRAKSESDALSDAVGNLNGVFAEGIDETGDFEDSLGSMADQVRTLVDYANDLSSVWSRAFEIRFSPQQTLDAITTSFQGIRDASESARRNIRGLQAEISGLNSDINIQQQFLGIAQQYGDTTRAQAIQANLSKLQADLAEKTASLAEEREKDNKTLVGNSKAAIQNRTTLTGLVQQYQAHIQSLANSGLSTEELQRQTEQLRQDFITQATQLGFNRGELGLYEQSFRDVTVAIQNVPRDITVAFNADPALQAMNEFVARAKQAGVDSGTGFATGFNNGLDNMQTAVQKANEIIALVKDTFATSTGGRARAGGGSFGATTYEGWLKAPLAGIRGFADGGYTGRGGKYEAAGVVHRGEYVIPAKHVNQATGLPNADAMGRLQRGAPTRQGYANGGFVRGGGFGGPMDLSASTIQQLAMVMDKLIVADGRVLGETASRSYQTGTTVGKY